MTKNVLRVDWYSSWEINVDHLGEQSTRDYFFSWLIYVGKAKNESLSLENDHRTWFSCMKSNGEFWIQVRVIVDVWDQYLGYYWYIILMYDNGKEYGKGLSVKPCSPLCKVLLCGIKRKFHIEKDDKRLWDSCSHLIVFFWKIPSFKGA